MQITATFDSLEEMRAFAAGLTVKKEPVMETAAKEKEPVTSVSAEEPATEEAPVAEEEAYTLVEVRAALARLSKEGKKEQVQELIQSFGADKLSQIPEEKYSEVMQKAGEL